MIGQIDPRPEDIDAETRTLRRKLFDAYGADVDLIGLAAIGITRHAWRSDIDGHVEEAHHRISDGEMFAANAATTRLVREHLGTHPDVDWQKLADAFTDPSRVAGRRTLIDLLGKTRHRRWANWTTKFIVVIDRIICQDGAENVLANLASWGGAYDTWWAGPRWPQLVDAFIAQLTADPPGMTTEQLRSGLLDAPDRMDPAILDWCTDAQLIGYTRLTR